MQQEILTASNYIVALEDKCYSANKTSLELLQTVRALEEEIGTLKHYIMDLKRVYIPVRGDPIDMKLADYINECPNRTKLKTMFLRECAGVYEFGQSKCVLKVERQNILVKKGSGFILIDEWLEQQMPVEMERMGRKEPPAPIMKVPKKVAEAAKKTAESR